MGTGTDDFGSSFPEELSPGVLWRMLVQNQQQMIQFQAQQLSYQAKMDVQLATIHDVISQAKGGWKVMVMVGAAVSGVVGYFLHDVHFFR
jgi:hypothetical protein